MSMIKLRSIRNIIITCAMICGIYTAWVNTAYAVSEDIIDYNGEVSEDYAGTSVASAGDVNNDGYADILVSAPYNNSNTGVIYLIYGNSIEATTVDLSHGDIVQFTGESVESYVGTSVASAGDVNNDGFSDILIGAQHVDSAAGAAYLIYGQAAPLTSANLSTAIKFSGETAGNQAGNSVASAGDVNNDGYSDILIGAYDFSGASAGAAYLIYGQAAPLASANLSTAIKFSGETAGDEAGRSVASAGDVNNDGFSDILIGADLNNNDGSVYLMYGQSSPLTSANLSTAIKFSAEYANSYTGQSVASAGDVNGDGFSDFLIGAPYAEIGESVLITREGAAYLVYGQSTPFVSHNLSSEVEFFGYIISGQIGSHVASLGDMNNDGYTDFSISGASGEGYSYIILGQSTEFISQELTDYRAAFYDGSYGNFKENDIVGAGDVNNDNYADILFTNSTYNDNTGAAYLMYYYADRDGDSILGGYAGIDCDDTNAAISENQTYYQDADSDGLGSDATYNVCSSTPPEGYVTNSNDTNDNDFDNDGSETGTDCNDADADISANQTYYADDDEDGLGSDVSTSICSLSVPAGYVTNSNDTNDTDYDNDGSETGTDCNDADADISANQTYYADDDADGLGSDVTTSVCSLTAPSGYVTNSNDTNDTDYDNDGSETGTDCNDADAAISANQTYYADVDADGLGNPNSSTTVCSLTAPAGYVTDATDTNDTIQNNGVEIYGDSIDNDGDNEVDEVNTTTENGAHPYFSLLDPTSTEIYAASITQIKGIKNGKIKVYFSDGSVYRYTIFDIDTDNKTIVKQHKKSGWLLVLRPNGKKLKLVNPYTGESVSTLKLSEDQSYKKNSLKQYNLREDQDAGVEVIITSKNENKVRLTIVKVKINDRVLKKKDTVTFKKDNVDVSKTLTKSKSISLRNSNSITLLKYSVSKKYQLSLAE